MTTNPVSSTESTALADSALVQWGLGEAKAEHHHRRENDIYWVTFADGQRAVLRVHRRGYQTKETLESELTWMDALRASGIDTPVSIESASGERVIEVVDPDGGLRSLCSLIRWIPGDPLDESNAVDAFRQLGSINARLHLHAVEWTPPVGFIRQRWDAEGLVGESANWGPYGDLSVLDSQQRSVCDSAKRRVVERLEKYGQGRDRFGLIHADLMPGNVLVHDGEARIIDFDDCGFGWFMYDFASLLTSHQGKDYYQGAYEAWIDGYRKVRSLSDEDLDIVDTLIMARQLTILGWLHTRPETEVARDYSEMTAAGVAQAAEAFIARA